MNITKLTSMASLLALALTLATSPVLAQPGRGGGPPMFGDFPRLGNDPEFIPPGQNPDFIPPGRNPGFIPPGQNPDFVPPGQNPDFTPPGQDPDHGPGHGGNDGLPSCPRGPGGSGPSGQAGLSSIAHLNFSALEFDDAPDNEGWARMMYRWYAPVFDFVFNGHQLPVDVEFTLTYQPQPLPSAGVICLGSGTVNDEGNIHIQDAFDIATDLPAAYDESEDEAMLALVLSADVDCEAGDMVGWQPEAYLFGDESMFYVHSDLDEDDDDNGDD